MQEKTLREAVSADDLLNAVHPHIGKVESAKISTLFGVLTAKSRHVSSLNEANLESVALNIDTSRFIVTIGKSFILLTLNEGVQRRPVIKKSWQRIEQRLADAFTASLGDQDTYMDTDHLKWVYRYNRPDEPDELSGYDSEGKEVLLMTF